MGLNFFGGGGTKNKIVEMWNQWEGKLWLEFHCSNMSALRCDAKNPDDPGVVSLIPNSNCLTLRPSMCNVSRLLSSLLSKIWNDTLKTQRF